MMDTLTLIPSASFLARAQATHYHFAVLRPPIGRARGSSPRIGRAAVPVTASVRPSRLAPPSRPAHAEGSTAAALDARSSRGQADVPAARAAKAARRDDGCGAGGLKAPAGPANAAATRTEWDGFNGDGNEVSAKCADVSAQDGACRRGGRADAVGGHGDGGRHAAGALAAQYASGRHRARPATRITSTC